MDPSSKKRKTDENGAVVDDSYGSKLTPEDARKIIEPFTQEQLIDILQLAAVRHVDVLDAVRSIADRDPALRKLFIRGLGWETTTEGLRTLFSSYGDLEEAVVILDKATGKSKGFGFITFKHIDGALLALKEPSKKIDGRMTVTQLAAAGASGPTSNPPTGDASMRKIYVGNVPIDMPADRLLAHFSSYGEIEEGPLGFDKQTGKSRGFALFVYKTGEAANASLVDPVKTIDGHQMVCKLATEGKKGKPPGPMPVVGGAGIQGQTPPNPASDVVANNGVGAMPPPSSMPGPLLSQYGGPVGVSSFGGFGGFGAGHHGPSPLQSSIGGPGLSSVGSQVPSSLVGSGGGGGYGSGLVAPYGSTQYGGPGTAGFGGLGGASSLYRMPPTSLGMPSGGYPDGVGLGHYGLSSSPFPGSHHLQTGSSPVPKGLPPGGMYPNLPPYY